MSGHCLVITHLRARISSVKKVTGIRTSKYIVSQLTSSGVAEQYRQQIEEKWNCITLTEQDNGENCGRDVKQALIPWLRRCWTSWNQWVKEGGLMLNARLPQKTKTKHIV